MNVQSKKICLEPDAVSSISDDIKKQGWAFVDGATMAQKFNLDVSSWTSFSSYWETLCLDEHMAGQGAYRYRRYSEFELRNGDDLIKLPHSPYEQAKSINSLNGGIAWQFLPLEDGFVAHPFFFELLAGMSRVFDEAVGGRSDWNIRLHPCRIVTNDYEQGKPTPEGRHRDGVDYIVMMMVHREEITGGVTRVSDNLNKTPFEVQLTNPLDLIVGDDHQIMHEVSLINYIEASGEGYRDALVIAFTRKVK